MPPELPMGPGLVALLALGFALHGGECGCSGAGVSPTPGGGSPVSVGPWFWGQGAAVSRHRWWCGGFCGCVLRAGTDTSLRQWDSGQGSARCPQGRSYVVPMCAATAAGPGLVPWPLPGTGRLCHGCSLSLAVQEPSWLGWQRSGSPGQLRGRGAGRDKDELAGSGPAAGQWGSLGAAWANLGAVGADAHSGGSLVLAWMAQGVLPALRAMCHCSVQAGSPRAGKLVLRQCLPTRHRVGSTGAARDLAGAVQRLGAGGVHPGAA